MLIKKMKRMVDLKSEYNNISIYLFKSYIFYLNLFI